MPNLKLEITEDEKNFLLQLLNNVPITGKSGMKLVLNILAKLETKPGD